MRVDSITAEIEATRADPDLTPTDRARKLRVLRDYAADAAGMADRYLSNAEKMREAEASDAARDLLWARDMADLREVLLAEGEFTVEDLEEAGFFSHADLDRLAEEELLEFAIRGMKRGWKQPSKVWNAAQKQWTAQQAEKHPRGGGGKFRETPDAPQVPGQPPGVPPVPGADVHAAAAAKRAIKQPKAEVPVSPHLGHLQQEPVVTGDIEQALALLAQGRRVELVQPEQVCTLLEELQKLVQAAAAKGEAAPDIDLCNVTVKGTNIFCVETKGIPRAKMPQLKGVPTPGTKADAMQRDKRGEVDLSPLFRKHLLEAGVKMRVEHEMVSHLKASQNQLNGAKVAGIYEYLKGGGKIEGPPLFVSKDNYIVDGHHRWAAEIGIDFDDDKPDMKMEVEKIDMPILDLLQAANSFAAEYGIPQAGITQGFADPAGGAVPPAPSAPSPAGPPSAPAPPTRTLKPRVPKGRKPPSA